MIPSRPPYALAPTPFRFAGLAALAGRAPLGGQREVALATYLVARLAHDALPERGLLPPLRAERATSAKQWLSTLALPNAVRPALARLIDASGGDLTTIAEALAAVIAVTANFLDSGARSDLVKLAAVLQRP